MHSHLPPWAPKVPDYVEGTEVVDPSEVVENIPFQDQGTSLLRVHRGTVGKAAVDAMAVDAMAEDNLHDIQHDDQPLKDHR